MSSFDPNVVRQMMDGHVDSTSWIHYFGDLSLQDAMECLKCILEMDTERHKHTAVLIATNFYEQLTPKALIPLFESFQCYDGLYTVLHTFAHQSEEPEVIHKYIEAAARCEEWREVERICRNSNSYDPQVVKNCLMRTKLPEDARPLIAVCVRHDLVYEMIQYLYRNGFNKTIGRFVTKESPHCLPDVVAALLDCDCAEEPIVKVINNTPALFNVDELVTKLEERSRLKLLAPWLNQRELEGAIDSHIHNALAKIHIDTPFAEEFLKVNKYYDPAVIGKYCEKRNPQYAFLAYRRAEGQCTEQLIKLCYDNAYYKDLARFLIEKKDAALWGRVLSANNEHLKPLCDQICQVAPTSVTDQQELVIMVKAFMDNGEYLKRDLVELLERIINSNSQFSQRTAVQNLLIVSAIEVKSPRVLHYIETFDQYDPTLIANFALQKKYFEEAFAIFRKYDASVQAMQVLIENVDDLDRAYDFAKRSNVPEVWGTLARAQLKKGSLKSAVESFVKAEDPAAYTDIIKQCEKQEAWQPLVDYLQMARSKVYDVLVDTELCFAYAVLHRHHDLQELVASSTRVQLQTVADRCYEHGFYDSAKILYEKIDNYSKLALTIAKLHNLNEAVEMAQKAKDPVVWRQVCFVCVDAGEMDLAKKCGVNAVRTAEDLITLTAYYESRGLFKELIEVFQSLVKYENAHTGVYTELACAYAKYNPEKLMDHIEAFSRFITIPKVLKVALEGHLWAEAAFLHRCCEDYDSAANVIISHIATEAGDDTLLKEIIVKVVNVEIIYKAIQTYIDFFPKRLNDLLTAVASRVEIAKVIEILSRTRTIRFAEPFLRQAQSCNKKVLNECLNDLFIEAEDFESLRQSIETYDDFDKIALAKRLEKDELTELRRIAASVYTAGCQWKQAVEMCKKDGLYEDAMTCAVRSGRPEVVEDLLQYFLQQNLRECFVAALYHCYDLIQPAVVLQMALRHEVPYKLIAPFLIQSTEEYAKKVDGLSQQNKKFEDQNTKLRERVDRLEKCVERLIQKDSGNSRPTPQLPMPLPIEPQRLAIPLVHNSLTNGAAMSLGMSTTTSRPGSTINQNTDFF